jgi:hypothetical protein
MTSTNSEPTTIHLIALEGAHPVRGSAGGPLIKVARNKAYVSFLDSSQCPYLISRHNSSAP